MQPINNQGERHEPLDLISQFINKSNTLWFSYHGQILEKYHALYCSFQNLPNDLWRLGVILKSV